MTAAPSIESVNQFTYNDALRHPKEPSQSVGRSLEQFLKLTATRGSWYGGGSAVALACALSAALLEKLVDQSPYAASLRALRVRCAQLVEEDAVTFAGVIKAYYQQDRAAAKRSLKGAIAIPVAVHEAARRILTAAQEARKRINPRYRSDLTCVVALARAARVASEAFIDTNLKWLDDPAYARRVTKQLARRS